MQETVKLETQRLVFHKALMSLWELIDELNKYIDTQAPWALAKDPEKKPRLMTVLYTLAETLRQISLLLFPFMPQTSIQMRQQLGMGIKEGAPIWSETMTWGSFPSGTQIRKGPALFPRIEKGITKMNSITQNQKAALVSSLTALPFEEFQKWDLRVAKVLKAERVPKSKKLLKIEIDLGEKRTLVAGIGQDYTPEGLTGKEIVVVANLEPTKLMGVESQAMLLAARDEKGLKLIVPDGEILPGTKVK